MRTYIPFGTRNALDAGADIPVPPGYDAAIIWGLGESGYRFLAWVQTPDRSASYPATAVRNDAGIIPIVLSHYLSSTQRQRLEKDGWSYWDSTGNVLIRCAEPPVLISRQGASRSPVPNSEPQRLHSLKGRAAARVIVTLLRYRQVGSVHGLTQASGVLDSADDLTEIAPYARGLAQASGAGVGTVSRVVSLLRRENFFEPTGGGKTLLVVDRRALLERWAEDYDFIATHRAARYYSPLGREGALQAIHQSGAIYAVTGLRAATEIYAGYGALSPLPAHDLWLYTEALGEVERAGRLVPDRSGDIVVAPCDFLSGTYGEIPVGTYPRRVYPYRVAGDLLSQPGRYAEVGMGIADLLQARGAL